jgi:hypothetical protein
MATNKKTAAKKKTVSKKVPAEKNTPTEVTVDYITPPVPVAKNLYSVDDSVKRNSTGEYGIVVGFSSKNVSDVIVEWHSQDYNTDNIVDVLDVSEISPYDPDRESCDGANDGVEYGNAVRKSVIDILKALKGQRSADYIDAFCEAVSDTLCSLPTSLDGLHNEQD